MQKVFLGLALSLAWTMGASALTYDSFDTASDFMVTPTKANGNLRFGSGNANGGFTIAENNGVEVGLRAKLRYDQAGIALNKTNTDGAGNYFFDPADGDAPSGLAIWNFEWSIFTGDKVLDDFNWTLGVTAPSGAKAGINPTSLFLATRGNQPSFSFDFLAADNFAQGSQNVGSDLDSIFASWPLAEASSLGTFAFLLTGDHKTNSAHDISVSMNVNVVPVPAALPLLASAMGAFVWLRRRRQAQTA